LHDPELETMSSRRLRPILLLTALSMLSTLAACSSSVAEDTEAGNDAISRDGAVASGSTCRNDGQQMRSILTLTKGTESVTARFELSPGTAGRGLVEATVSETRDMTFATTDLERVRTLLRRGDLFAELTGDADGFREWEAGMKCAKAPAPTSLPTGEGSTCSVDPTGGSPLGSRSVLSIDQGDGEITVVYAKYPSVVDADLRITIASVRSMSFRGSLGIPRVRALLQDPSTGLADDLLGDMADEIGEIDRALECEETGG